MNGKYNCFLWLFIVLIFVTTSCNIFRLDTNTCPVCYGSGITHVNCPVCVSTGRCRICNNGYIPCSYCKTKPGLEYDKSTKKWMICKVCNGKYKTTNKLSWEWLNNE